ncbi:MAG TPA: hypothetical protein ENK66_01455 [Arcobacter sp.]|nr:hypothetical protein [Arcobacter sp.]
MLKFEKSKGVSYATTHDEWVSHLDKLINDEKYYQEKSKNTQNYVVNSCLMKHEVHKYENLFEDKK